MKAIARIISGKARIASTRRIRAHSTAPPINPARRPMTMPPARPSATEPKPMVSATLAPYSTREYRSWPNESVPSQWLPPGGCSASSRFWAIGSWVAMTGASSASRMKRPTMMRPITALRWRRIGAQ